MNELRQPDVIEVILSNRQRTIHPVAEVDEFSHHRPSRSLGRRIRHAAGHLGTFLHHGIVDYKWVIVGLVLGTGIGIPLGRVPNDSRTAANRAQPRLRRVMRHASGYSRISICKRQTYPASP